MDQNPNIKEAAELARNLGKQFRAVLAVSEVLEKVGDLEAHKNDLEGIIAEKQKAREALDAEAERLKGRISEEESKVHQLIAKQGKIEEECKAREAAANKHVADTEKRYKTMNEEIEKLKKKLGA